MQFDVVPEVKPVAASNPHALPTNPLAPAALETAPLDTAPPAAVPVAIAIPVDQFPTTPDVEQETEEAAVDAAYYHAARRLDTNSACPLPLYSLVPAFNFTIAPGSMSGTSGQFPAGVATNPGQAKGFTMGAACASSTLFTPTRYYAWGVFDAGTTLYIGTTVTISNCVMSPQAATIMAIGTGCPLSTSFNCLSVASAGCALGAQITYIVSAPTRYLYVLNGMSGTGTNSKMQFTYAINPSTATPSTTGSVSWSATVSGVAFECSCRAGIVDITECSANSVRSSYTFDEHLDPSFHAVNLRDNRAEM